MATALDLYYRGLSLRKVAEHFAPYLPEFKYNPKDARFIGSPVDLIIFDGLDEGDLRKVRIEQEGKAY